MWTESAKSILRTTRAQRVQVVAARVAVERATLASIPRRTFVTKFDNDRVFRALLSDAFEKREEWV